MIILLSSICPIDPNINLNTIDLSILITNDPNKKDPLFMENNMLGFIIKKNIVE